MTIVAHRSGIYTITNSVNGKCYIGSAVSLRDRRSKHFKELRGGTHHSTKLQNAWGKYGEHVFTFAPLLLCEKRDLLFYEQRAIDAYDAAKNGYNILPTAGSRLGVRHSDTTKVLISQKKTGVKRAPFSDAARMAMSLAQIGKRRCVGYKHTAEAHAKMRAKVISEAHRKAVSESLMGNQRAKGFKHTAETKAKVSAANIGRKNMLGKKLSEETKAKIASSQKGVPKTPEHRKKIGDAIRAACAKRNALCH